jgi:hypothetical protein
MNRTANAVAIRTLEKRVGGQAKLQSTQGLDKRLYISQVVHKSEEKRFADAPYPDSPHRLQWPLRGVPPLSSQTGGGERRGPQLRPSKSVEQEEELWRRPPLPQNCQSEATGAWRVASHFARPARTGAAAHVLAPSVRRWCRQYSPSQVFALVHHRPARMT